jgi:hypothetical protein
MRILIWIAAGLAAGAVAWTIAPDLRRYLKMSAM